MDEERASETTRASSQTAADHDETRIAILSVFVAWTGTTQRAAKSDGRLAITASTAIRNTERMAITGGGWKSISIETGWTEDTSIGGVPLRYSKSGVECQLVMYEVSVDMGEGEVGPSGTQRTTQRWSFLRV